MKQIIIFFILFLSFLSDSLAFDIFWEISESQISQNETFTFQVEALNNQDFDEWLLKIEWIENFVILSQNISVQSMSFNGVSSYKKEFIFTLQPKKTWTFTLQPIYKAQTEEVVWEKFEITVEKWLNHQKSSENNAKNWTSIFWFEIWFLWLWILIFLYFTKFYKPKNSFSVSWKIEKKSEIDSFFDNYIWSEKMDYKDLRIFFVKYLEKFHWFSWKFLWNYSEMILFLEQKNLDTEERNAIQSIILTLQSSEFSSDKFDKKDLFHKIFELKKFNKSN